MEKTWLGGFSTENTESSINYLGWITESFPTHAGIRQGFPFSPMVFFLALEVLALRIRFDKSINGLDLSLPNSSVCPSTLLKLILYADNITMFFKDKNDLDSALNIIGFLSVFLHLVINNNKTDAWKKKKGNIL